MQKALIILPGIGLLAGGGAYAAWWGKAARQARSFATLNAPTQGAFESQYPHLVRAFSILGVDLHALPDGGRPESPEALFSRILRGIRQRMIMGALAALAGLVTIATALHLTSRKGSNKVVG